MTPSIYINLEDDVDAIAARVLRQRPQEVVLVCPKQCRLFSDPSHLLRLKEKTDAMGKEIHILTMDQNGRDYAQAAGFGLREVPGASKVQAVSDIKSPGQKASKAAAPAAAVESLNENVLPEGAKEIKNQAKIFAKTSELKNPEPVVTPALGASVVHPEPVVHAAPEPIQAIVRDTIFPKELEDKIIKDVEKKPFSLKKFILGFIFIFILAAGAVYFLLPKASVVIYPKTETVSRDMEVTMGTGISQADPTKLTLPAIKVYEVIEASSTFDSQGKQQIGNKASGTVKLYNFTKLPVNLKSATTVLQANGQAYMLVDDVVQVKPTKYLNSSTKEVNPDSLGDSVKIVAINGGEDANLPEGTRLEITNKVFGSKPQLLYAKTDSPMTGGVSRLVSIISNQDLSSAQETLKQNILSQIRESLAQKGLAMIDNAFSFQINGFTSDMPVNTQTPVFKGKMTATVTGLAFESKAMENLVLDRIKQSVATNKTLVPLEPLEKSYMLKTIDLTAETGVVSLNFRGKAISSVNIAGVSNKLVGKTAEEANDLLNNKTEIDHIDITLAPSWQKTFPVLTQRIDVKVAD